MIPSRKTGGSRALSTLVILEFDQTIASSLPDSSPTVAVEGQREMMRLCGAVW